MTLSNVIFAFSSFFPFRSRKASSFFADFLLFVVNVEIIHSHKIKYTYGAKKGFSLMCVCVCVCEREREKSEQGGCCFCAYQIFVEGCATSLPVQDK